MAKENSPEISKVTENNERKLSNAPIKKDKDDGPGGNSSSSRAVVSDKDDDPGSAS